MTELVNRIDYVTGLYFARLLLKYVENPLQVTISNAGLTFLSLDLKPEISCSELRIIS